MGKVLIVGSCGDCTAIAKALADMPTGHEVIEAPVNTERSMLIRNTDSCEPELLELPFFPRAKHEHKGHERKYKYHK